MSVVEIEMKEEACHLGQVANSPKQRKEKASPHNSGHHHRIGEGGNINKRRSVKITVEGGNGIQNSQAEGERIELEVKGGEIQPS